MISILCGLGRKYINDICRTYSGPFGSGGYHGVHGSPPSWATSDCRAVYFRSLNAVEPHIRHGPVDLGRGPQDRIKTRILQHVISGIRPLVWDLRARMQDPMFMWSLGPLQSRELWLNQPAAKQAREATRTPTEQHVEVFAGRRFKHILTMCLWLASAAHRRNAEPEPPTAMSGGPRSREHLQSDRMTEEAQSMADMVPS